MVFRASAAAAAAAAAASAAAVAAPGHVGSGPPSAVTGLMCTTCSNYTRAPPPLFYNCSGCGLYLTYCARLPIVICAVCLTVFPPTPTPSPYPALAPLIPSLRRPPRPPPRLPPRGFALLPSSPVTTVPHPVTGRVRPPPRPVPPEPPPIHHPHHFPPPMPAHARQPQPQQQPQTPHVVSQPPLPSQPTVHPATVSQQSPQLSPLQTTQGQPNSPQPQSPVLQSPQPRRQRHQLHPHGKPQNSSPSPKSEKK